MRKKTLGLLCMVGTLLLFSSTKSFSQVQIGLHGSRLEGTGASQWGFGGNVKVLFGDKFAVGVAARGYPKNMKTDTRTIGNDTYKILSGNTIVPVTGSFDYYFGKTGIRPYLGADAGAYFTQYTYSSRNNNGSGGEVKNSHRKTYFGAAPRAGLNVGFGPVGIFGQAGYNLLFGSGDKNEITVPGVTNPIDTKPADKFWTFDVGLYFKIGGK